ncbi:MAG: hypothetical protein NUV32_09060 [Exilispira sp.]|jgi:hypothetical protein|nr:hypothetical protein [Exilispira sp.]
MNNNIIDIETNIFYYISKASIGIFVYCDNLLSIGEFNINT